MPAAPITAVMVTYQSAHTLPSALAAMRRCHDAGLLECVVVDNGSTDATTSMLESESSWIRTILTKRNNGFGRGSNLGLAHVATPYTLFLNPDAAIEPDALRTLLEFMQTHPRVGIAGPATLCGQPGETPTLQQTGVLPTPRSMFLGALPLLGARRSLLSPIVPGSAPRRTGWVCGAIFLIRTELLQSLAGFDPRFFLYWEETDLCRRAANAGFETWALGTALAHHVAGASSSDDDTRISGCIARHYYQSRRYYMVKHHGWLAATAAETGELLCLYLQAAWDLVRGRGLRRLRPRLQAPFLSQPSPPG